MVGNIPNFTKIDILRCFLKLGKSTGRKDLAHELGLGEGTVRTILNVLKSKKLLDSTKKGHFLSKKGNEMLNYILEFISIPKSISINNIYPEFKKVGIVAKGISNLKGLYKLRDTAVKNGAEGAMILRYHGKLYTLESEIEHDFKELENSLELHNNDVVVIAFSNDSRHSEIGALAITAELNDSLKKFINEM